MGIKDFAIATNHPFNKYKPGQNVRGKVQFTLNETIKLRGVYVQLKGKAKVSWSEKNGGKSSTHYSGEHEYFKERIYFIGESDGETFELPPGDYNYKFNYILPFGLPSTYKNSVGGVKYTVKGVLDVPWGFDDEEEIELELTSPIELNTKQYTMHPYRTSTSKHVYFLCCQSGPLTMDIGIPKRGYAPGENIQINVEIENKSNTDVTSLQFKLKQIVTSHAELPRHRTRENTDTLFEYEFAGLPRHSSNSYNKTLLIPKTIVPLSFDNCNVFDVKYELKVEANLGAFHFDLSKEIPIELGNVPVLGRSEPTAPPVSILTGLGSPYPHTYPNEGADYETRRSNNRLDAIPSHLFEKDFGWTTEVLKS